MSENKQELVVTKEGLQKLKDELEHLKTVTRYEVIEKLRIARGYGDLSENSEYDEAKTNRALLKGGSKNLKNRFATSELLTMSRRMKSGSAAT